MILKSKEIKTAQGKACEYGDKTRVKKHSCAKTAQLCITNPLYETYFVLILIVTSGGYTK